MRLCQSLNAPAFLIHQDKNPPARSLTGLLDQVPDLLRVLHIAPEQDDPGRLCRGKKICLAKGEGGAG